MHRAVVRNTFLSFEEDFEAKLAVGSGLKRSKSAGDEPDGARHSEDEEDAHLGRLNYLLRKDPASPGHLIEPLPASGGGVGVDELRRLQQKLREVASPGGSVRAVVPEDAGCALPKVTSNGSVSTMVPEDADPGHGQLMSSLRNVGSSTSVCSMISDWQPRPSLRNVGSSNSVCSMVSEPPRWEEASAEDCSPQGGARVFGFKPSAPAGAVSTQVPKKSEFAKNVVHDSASHGQQPKTSPLRNVGSSNSITSMVSEPRRWDDCRAEDARYPRNGRDHMHSSPPAPKDYCHNQVPKKCDLAKDFARSDLAGPPTTMMIRNIPNHYTQCHMVRELEALGFQNSYDFLYVPIDRGTQGSVGYCFVNFVTPEWAVHCARAFSGRPFEKHRRDRRGKVAVVSVAHLQGLEANLRHYKNAAVTGSAQVGKGNGPMIIANLARALS